MNYQNPIDLQATVANLQNQISQFGFNHNAYPAYPAYPPPAPVYTPSVTVPQPQIVRQVNSVHGIKGALEYQSKLAPASNDIVLDDENDIIYFVRKDANGNVPEKLTIGDFKLRKEKYDENEYVTKQDFDNAIDKIMKLVGKDNA